MRKSLLFSILLISVFSPTPSAKAFVQEYRMWLVPGLVASGIQFVPQAIQTYFSHSLASDPQMVSRNSTAKLIFLESASAIGTNLVVFVVALPLTFRFKDPTRFQECSAGCALKKTLETTMALSALGEAGFHIACMYQTVPLFNLYSGQSERPQALVPTLTLSLISGVTSIFIVLTAVGTFVVPFCFAKQQYEQV